VAAAVDRTEMTRALRPPCENAFTAVQLMGRENINQLPVVSNGHLEGVVTRSYFVHLLRLRRELSM
jgi:CBS domain-containing protein